MTDSREFISYASGFDLYKGILDWNDLSSSDQDMIILYLSNEELLATVGEFDSLESFVKSTSLKKVQYEGLRAIIVYCVLFLEQHGNIDENTPQETIQFYLRLLLKDTPVGQRLQEAWDSETGTRGGPRTALDDKALEGVAGNGLKETVLHQIMDMDWNTAEEFLAGILGRSPVANPSTPETPPVVNVLDRAWSLLEHDERRLLLDAAAMGNINALQYLRANLASLKPPLSEQAIRVLGRKRTWWVRLAQRMLG